MKRIGMQIIKFLSDKINKLIIDFLLFSLTFLGMIGLNDSSKITYFTVSIIIFLVLEIFFALLQSNWLFAVLSQAVIYGYFLVMEPIGAINPAMKAYTTFLCSVLQIIWFIHTLCGILSVFRKNDIIMKWTLYIKGYLTFTVNWSRYAFILIFFIFYFRCYPLNITYYYLSFETAAVISLEVALLILYIITLKVQEKSLSQYTKYKNVIFLNVKYLTTPYRLFHFENFFLFRLGRSYALFSSRTINILEGIIYDDYLISQYSAINYNESVSKNSSMIVRVDSNKYYSRNSLKKISKWLSWYETRGTKIFIEDGAKKANYKNEAPISSMLKMKYPYYYKEKNAMNANCWDLIIEMELENRQSVKLNDIQNVFDECHKLMDQIDDGQIQYFSHYKKALQGMNKTFLQDFYNLILVAEYMIHYEALMVLSEKEITDKEREILASPSLGDFVNLISDDKKYSKELYEDIITSARLLDCIAVRNGKTSIKLKEISRKQILQVICRVRNRFLGHGTIIYAVSGEMVLALGRLVKLLMDEFANLKDKQSLIDKYLFEAEKIPFLYKKHTVLFNGMNKEGFCFFLDYVTGYTVYPYEKEQYENESVAISTLRYIK